MYNLSAVVCHNSEVNPISHLTYVKNYCLVRDLKDISCHLVLPYYIKYEKVTFSSVGFHNKKNQ